MMSTIPASPTNRAEALAAFDTARDRFLVAFAQAPDEALAFVPPGDEYAVGVLVPHLVDPMERYMNQFRRILQANFGPLDFSTDTERLAREAQHHAELAAMRPTGADRPRLLAEMEAAHQQVRHTVGQLEDATFTRQAPVIYAGGSEPYPTSCRDIMGWLIDHYDEHTTQVADLLTSWWRRGL